MRESGRQDAAPFRNVKLVLLGSSNGANAGTGAALDASVCIDNVLAVSLGNAGNGAFAGAGAAGDAIVADLISHFIILLTQMLFIFYHARQKIAIGTKRYLSV